MFYGPEEKKAFTEGAAQFVAWNYQYVPFSQDERANPYRESTSLSGAWIDGYMTAKMKWDRSPV